MRHLAILTVGVLLVGCGTVMHGTHQTISIASGPQGAQVVASPEAGTYTTPATLTLQRNHEYVLTFSKAGYTPATLNITKDIGPGTVVADILLGLVPLVIDAATGAWYGLNPESANVTLARVGGSEHDSDAIHISVSRVNPSGAAEVRSSAPGVSLKLIRK